MFANSLGQATLGCTLYFRMCLWKCTCRCVLERFAVACGVPPLSAIQHYPRNRRESNFVVSTPTCVPYFHRLGPLCLGTHAIPRSRTSALLSRDTCKTCPQEHALKNTDSGIPEIPASSCFSSLLRRKLGAQPPNTRTSSIYGMAKSFMLSVHSPEPSTFRLKENHLGLHLGRPACNHKNTECTVVKTPMFLRNAITVTGVLFVHTNK